MRNEDTITQISDDLNDNDKAIARLLGGLKRVESPGDFYIRLRTRIALGKAEQSTLPWLPLWVRVSIPLILVLLVGGYFGSEALKGPADGNVAVVAEPESIGPDSGLTPQPVTVPRNETAAVNDAGKTPPSRGGEISGVQVPKENPTGVDDKRPGGGSYDEAVNSGKRILPRGLDPDAPRPSKPEDFKRDVQITVTEVLTLIGLNASYRGSNWIVESVTDHSTAERVGLKSGDVIEAINNQKLTQNTAFKGNFSGKSIRLRRGNRQIVIDLVKY